MTEGTNRQRVLDFINTLYSGDVEATLERCTDDIEFLANAPIDILPHMGHRRGKAEMREMWDAVRARYS
jgi:ketosteroid isomerase-like protein